MRGQCAMMPYLNFHPDTSLNRTIPRPMLPAIPTLQTFIVGPAMPYQEDPGLWAALELVN